MRMALHLLDRPRALAQAERVIGPGGRVVIATEDPASFDARLVRPYFPSVPAIDGARFPDVAGLRDELAAAGLPTIRVERARPAPDDQPRTRRST